MLGFSICKESQLLRSWRGSFTGKTRAAEQVVAAPDCSICADLADGRPSKPAGRPLDYHFRIRVLVEAIFLDFFSLDDFFAAMESPSI
jgi:hypothetical protein